MEDREGAEDSRKSCPLTYSKTKKGKLLTFKLYIFNVYFILSGSNFQRTTEINMVNLSLLTLIEEMEYFYILLPEPMLSFNKTPGSCGKANQNDFGAFHFVHSLCE